MIRNRGFAQIPLMLSLLVLAIALPVLSRVVKQTNDTRNRATDEVCVIVPPSVVAEAGECSTTQGCARMVFLPETVGGGETGLQFCKSDCDCPEIVDGDNAFCGECKLLPVEPTETPIETPPDETTPTISPTSTPSATLTPTIPSPPAVCTPVPCPTGSVLKCLEGKVCEGGCGMTCEKLPTPPCDPTICDPEYDCLLNRCGGTVLTKSCDKCFPATDSAKKKDYCTGCEPTATPTLTPTPVVYCTPVPCPTGGKFACPTGSCMGGCGMVCLTPTPIISVTPTTPPVVTPGECKMPVIEDYFSVKFDKLTPEVDIVFAFDTTGSMDVLIKKAKEKGLELLKGLDTKLGEKVRFAVVDFRDYPVAPYGSSGDYPYKLDVDFTNDKTKVMNAINGLTLGHGADMPESYLTVMHNVKDLKWRDGAKKILIFLADSIEHDPEVDGTKAITMEREISYYKDKGISLLYLDVAGNYGVNDHWGEISKKIGNGSGSFRVMSITTSSTDFVDIIMKLVVGVVRKVDKLYLNTKPATYAPWLKYTAMVGVTIPVEGAEIKFPYSINPSGMDDGVYEFVVDLMGDKTKYAEKSQKVEIKCPCGKLDQKCCVGEGDEYCDEGLDCDTDRNICKIACPPCKAIGDYSCDGEISGLDYSWWKQEFVDQLQHEGKWEASHICGEVTSEDYSVWRDGYLR